MPNAQTQTSPSLDTQIQDLINAAPSDPETLAAINAIAPALKQFAERLSHRTYYIVQSVEQNWAITYLANINEQQAQTAVLFAFPTLKDASGGPYPLQDPSLIALPIPTVDLLFQFLSIPEADCLIFYERPGDFETAVEIHRSEFNQVISQHLQPLTIPADLA
jgi:hypothetical protein